MKLAAFLALFSPAAWRAAGRTVREAVIIARNMALAAAAVVALVTYWWQQQSETVHAVVIIFGAGLGCAWLYHLLGGRRVKVPRRPPTAAEPTQVLYRWWEPDDLPEGTICFCGKPRVAGELVYVGITGAHRSRELDEDRRQACWWQPGLIGTTETFMTRDQVEAAEIRAIRNERPRENKQHARGWAA